MIKFRTSRKDHDCGYCAGKIKKGDKYHFFSERTAKYDEEGYQIGIEYITFKMCMACDEAVKATEV